MPPHREQRQQHDEQQQRRLLGAQHVAHLAQKQAALLW
jgi:hypothetical protein